MICIFNRSQECHQRIVDVGQSWSASDTALNQVSLGRVFPLLIFMGLDFERNHPYLWLTEGRNLIGMREYIKCHEGSREKFPKYQMVYLI